MCCRTLYSINESIPYAKLFRLFGINFTSSFKVWTITSRQVKKDDFYRSSWSTSIYFCLNAHHHSPFYKRLTHVGIPAYPFWDTLTLASVKIGDSHVDIRNLWAIYDTARIHHQKCSIANALGTLKANINSPNLIYFNKGV